MKLVKYVLIFSFPGVLLAQGKDCPTDPSFQSVDSQRRYHDFFQHRKEREGMASEIESGISEVREQRDKMRKEDARALEEFLRTRKREVVDPKLEQSWLEEKKAEKEQEEVARKRFVQARDCFREQEGRGAKIPGNIEFDLDTD